MSTQELALESEAERLRQEQAQLLKEREELERTNQQLLQQNSPEGGEDGLSDTQNLLKQISSDIQELHEENEKLKQDVLDLDKENALLKQAINLPEGADGDQILRETVAALEAPPSARHCTAMALSDNPEGQRDALRDAQQELLQERARLRAEAAQLCGDLQETLKERIPTQQASTEAPPALVLDEYGTLSSQHDQLQQENERLKKEIAECSGVEEQDDAETHVLRRQLTAAMLRHTFFPPKATVPEPRKFAMPEEEFDEFKDSKTRFALQQLLRVTYVGK